MQLNRRAIIALAKAQRDKRQPCARCGQPIDYTVPDGSTPDSYNYGHIKPTSTHPHLAYDPLNGQSEHDRCNKGAGNRDVTVPLGSTSRDW